MTSAPQTTNGSWFPSLLAKDPDAFGTATSRICSRLSDKMSSLDSLPAGTRAHDVRVERTCLRSGYHRLRRRLDSGREPLRRARSWDRQWGSTSGGRTRPRAARTGTRIRLRAVPQCAGQGPLGRGPSAACALGTLVGPPFIRAWVHGVHPLAERSSPPQFFVCGGASEKGRGHPLARTFRKTA